MDEERKDDVGRNRWVPSGSMENDNSVLALMAIRGSSRRTFSLFLGRPSAAAVAVLAYNVRSRWIPFVYSGNIGQSPSPSSFVCCP
jgi:hypothetical protein